MSTLREIAENHAKKAMAMEAESAYLTGRCSTQMPETESPDAAHYLQPHTFTAISENLQARAVIYAI